MITLVGFLSSMFHNVLSWIGSFGGWKVALVALVRFLPSVNEEVSLQITSLAKWLVALRTFVLLVSTVGLLVIVKAWFACKVLGTQVTRLSICHLQFEPPLLTGSPWSVAVLWQALNEATLAQHSSHWLALCRRGCWVGGDLIVKVTHKASTDTLTPYHQICYLERR